MLISTKHLAQRNSDAVVFTTNIALKLYIDTACTQSDFLV